jgi:hypothetical protein
MTKIKLIRKVFGEYIPLLLFLSILAILNILCFPFVLFRAIVCWVQSENSFIFELKDSWEKLGGD